jgi:branched-subunit amino acid ABC-type transport system permease component
MTAGGDHDRDLMRRAIELARRGPRGVNPQVGAVLGKIAILVFIILFIQKRPQGLFALKGRQVD